MGSFSIWHWIIVLLIVLLLFGAGKLPTVMGDLAKGIKAFKSGLKDQDEEEAQPAPPPAVTTPPAAAPSATATPAQAAPSQPVPSQPAPSQPISEPATVHAADPTKPATGTATPGTPHQG